MRQVRGQVGTAGRGLGDQSRNRGEFRPIGYGFAEKSRRSPWMTVRDMLKVVERMPPLRAADDLEPPRLALRLFRGFHRVGLCDAYRAFSEAGLSAVRTRESKHSEFT